MHPLLLQGFPSYFAMWICAAGGGMLAGILLGRQAGFPAWRSALALASAVVSILLGSKILYLLETYFFPGEDYVPVELHGSLHGFRIPGGILLLALTTLPVCNALRLPWRRFGDLLIPLAAFALVFIRCGCFLNGCCFGKVSPLPWAIRFPRGSWVFWYHRARGWIPDTAPASLPVHPLQLYFVIASALTLGVLLWQKRHSPQPGSQQLTFYTLFFGTTALLEPLRQNSLTLNNWLTAGTTVVLLSMLVASSFLVRPEAALKVWNS